MQRILKLRSAATPVLSQSLKSSTAATKGLGAINRRSLFVLPHSAPAALGTAVNHLVRRNYMMDPFDLLRRDLFQFPELRVLNHRAFENTFVPRCSIARHSDGLQIEVEVPGIAKKDLTIDIKGDRHQGAELVIRGEKRMNSPLLSNSQQQQQQLASSSSSSSAEEGAASSSSEASSQQVAAADNNNANQPSSSSSSGDVQVQKKGDRDLRRHKNKGNNHQPQQQHNNNDHWAVQERFFGSFERTISLPPNADVDNIKAKMEHGVLHVFVPYVQEAQPSARTVNIE